MRFVHAFMGFTALSHVVLGKGKGKKEGGDAVADAVADATVAEVPVVEGAVAETTTTVEGGDDKDKTISESVIKGEFKAFVETVTREVGKKCKKHHHHHHKHHHKKDDKKDDKKEEESSEECDEIDDPEHGRLVFDLKCAEACFRTPSCRRDPHSHGSYCKKDHHPKTCFGLYYEDKFKEEPRKEEDGKGDDGKEMKDYGHSKHKLCFQPNDEDCPEQFPVLCGRRHHKGGKH